MKYNFGKTNNKGFTLVESVIVALLASLIMYAIQALFTHSVRSALKGEDSLDSMRAASKLFSSLQTDFLQLTNISTQGAICSIPIGTNSIPTTATYSSILEIGNRVATVTYNIVTDSSGKHIERVEQKGGTSKTRKFGIPRIKKFEVLIVQVNNKLGGADKINSQVLVNVVVKSQNKNFPSSEIKLSSFFFPDRLTTTDWNYIIF